MSDDLVTNIVADAEGFSRGTNQAMHDADRLESHVEHMADAIQNRFTSMAGSISGSLGVGFGFNKFIEGMKGQMDKVEELKHLSERSGADLNNLRALQYEAKHLGAEIETLTKSTTKFQVNLGEAVGGGKKAGLFAQLGLDPDSLAKMDPVEALAKTGDAIAAIENPTSRVHMAFELFGKTGAESLNVILQGTKGLHDAMAKVGIISPEDVDELHKAHEALLDMDAAGQKLERTFAANLAPAVEKVAGILTDAAKAIGIIGEHTAASNDDYALHSAGKGFDARGNELHAPSMMKYLFGAGGDDLIQSMDDVPMWGASGLRMLTKAEEKEAAKKKKDADEKRIREEESRQKHRDDLNKESDRMDEQAQHLVEQSDPHAKAERESREVQELYFIGKLDDTEMRNALDDIAERYQKDMEAHDPLKKQKEEMKQMREEAGRMLDSADPGKKLEDQLAKIRKMYEKGAVNEDQANELIDKASEDFARANGLGELFDNKDRIKAPQKIEMAGAGEGAYQQFFKNLQPNTDTEAAKQTALLEKLKDVNVEVRQAIVQMNQGLKQPNVVTF
jgi:hypothetical protein